MANVVIIKCWLCECSLEDGKGIVFFSGFKNFTTDQVYAVRSIPWFWKCLASWRHEKLPKWVKLYEYWA